jgi:serine protease AprX
MHCTEAESGLVPTNWLLSSRYFMTLLAFFRRLATRRALLSGLARAATLTALSASLLGGAAHAQTAPIPKISTDLRAALAAAAGSTPSVTWARNLSGVLHVKVLINASSTDAELTTLRHDILARGGSVTYNYLSVRALAAMLPAAAVPAIAARTDVLNIAPNRVVSRHASKASKHAGTTTTATATAPVTTSGLNGAGVGIAILDTGIDWQHRDLLGADGLSRVRGEIDIPAVAQALGMVGWVKGVDFSPIIKSALAITQYSITAPSRLPSGGTFDPYGHGTHVASVAAGNNASGSYRGVATWPTCSPASTGWSSAHAWPTSAS